jgi:hypothetical protein
MFGQKDNDNTQQSGTETAAEHEVQTVEPEQTASEVPADANASPENTEAPAPPTEITSIPPVPDSVTSEPTVPPVPAGDQPAADDAGAQDWQHPGTPIDTPQADAAEEPATSAPAAPAPINDIISPYGDQPSAPASSLPPIAIPSLDSKVSDDSGSVAADASDSSDGNLNHDLIDIKQKALGELSPLIDELDQSPEDKFRTLMMMIQASDDQNLVSKAYEAAHAIEDEKSRAQALLDIVNEINYFTQHPQG